jgi:hypothetical protein
VKGKGVSQYQEQKLAVCKSLSEELRTYTSICKRCALYSYTMNKRAPNRLNLGVLPDCNIIYQQEIGLGILCNVCSLWQGTQSRRRLFQTCADALSLL